jgi:hypothetical protein
LENISPKKRVENALRRMNIDKVPFAVWYGLDRKPGAECPILPFGYGWLPQCSIERTLRNQGLCIIYKRLPGYKTFSPNVKITSTVYEERDKLMFRTDFNTPLGSLHTIKEVTEITYWTHKRLFSKKEDYKIINFLINDIIVQSDNDSIYEALKMLGEDVFIRGDLGYEPLQSLITGDFFTIDQFCIEWMENRDEILELYKSLVQLKRKIYKIAAASPLFYFDYGGNLIPEVTSPDDYVKYFKPNYEEAAETLHNKGKILGCHYDANLKTHKDLIAGTPLDVIEAFTPYPDTDITMSEARKIFKDKVLWINFPSSVHLKQKSEIAEVTSKIIDDAGPTGLIIGITEDVPQNRWQESYMTIMQTIDKKFNIKPARSCC